MADDWSFLDNIDFGGDWVGTDWASQTPTDWWDASSSVDWFNPSTDWLSTPVNSTDAMDWFNPSSDWLSNPVDYSSSSNLLGDAWKGLNSVLGSNIGQAGLGLLMGSIAQNASRPAGSQPYISSTTNPDIARLMTAMGLAPTELLSSIMNERANVAAQGVMTPESLAALKNATLGYAIDPSSNILNSAILNYIMTGGQKTPEEIKALESYEAAMGPQLLQKTQDLIRQMGGGAWSSGPMAQLMQDAIARAQLESAANYAGFLNTQGTELANRQTKVAGNIPSLTEAYTNPMEWVMKLIAGFELPGEQTRARTDQLAGTASTMMGNIMGKASPTQTSQVSTPAYTPYWASILSNAASGVGAGGLNQTIAGIGDTVSSLGKLFGIT